jgi:hypothetical protein
VTSFPSSFPFGLLTNFPFTQRSIYTFAGQSISLSFFGNRFGGANIFTSREAFLEVGGFTEYVDVACEDYEFLVRAALKAVLQVVIPEPLLWVRRYSEALLVPSSSSYCPPPVLTTSFFFFSSSKIKHWYALNYGQFSLQISSPLPHTK